MILFQLFHLIIFFHEVRTYCPNTISKNEVIKTTFIIKALTNYKLGGIIMKVELYMASIDEDFSSRTLKRIVEYSKLGGKQQNNPTSWGNWDNWNNWTNWTNWSNFSAMHKEGLQVSSHCFNQIRIRQESFGGLAYHPMSSRVFKLDDEAFSALKLLVEGSSFKDIASAIGRKKKDIERLAYYVCEA